MILILNCIFPSNREIKTHLNVDKAVIIAQKARPDYLVLTHFGMQMLNANPVDEAKRVERITGVKTIAAEDGLTLDLDNPVKQMIKQSKLV